MKLLVTAILSLVIHLLVGWAWTMGAGVVVGLWTGPRGWLYGGGGVGSGWLALVLYNVVVAPGPVGTMAATLGGILGNAPGFVVFGVTVLVGVLLGTVGGGLGTQINLLLRARGASSPS